MKNEKKREDTHRSVNTGLALAGTGVAGLGAVSAYKAKKKLSSTLDDIKSDVANTTKTARDAIQSNPALDRTNAGRKFRRKEAAHRKEVMRRAKRIKQIKARKAWPKWRKVLNKLPGGKKTLFSESGKTFRGSLHEMVESKQRAKTFSSILFDDDQMKANRALQRGVRKAVTRGRRGTSAIQDVVEVAKGERKNKRRKRFWEKKANQDWAIATGLSGLAIGGGYLARKKFGDSLRRKINPKVQNVVQDLEAQTKMLIEMGVPISKRAIEFISGPTIEQVMGQKKKEGWRMSRPTSKSVRLHQDKGRRRRRSKRWHERKSNRDKMLYTAAGLSLATPLAAYMIARRGKGNIGRRMHGIRVKARKQGYDKGIKQGQRVRGQDAGGASGTVVDFQKDVDKLTPAQRRALEKDFDKGTKPPADRGRNKGKKR
jgi:hypothetical protein